MAFEVVARLHESVQQLTDNFGDAMDLMWSSKYQFYIFICQYSTECKVS